MINTDKERAKEFFKKTKEVTSPAFPKEKIVFSRIKVIVRQVGQGKKHFWSVIPAWRRIRGQLVNAKGDLRKG